MGEYLLGIDIGNQCLQDCSLCKQRNRSSATGTGDISGCIYPHPGMGRTESGRWMVKHACDGNPKGAFIKEIFPGRGFEESESMVFPPPLFGRAWSGNRSKIKTEMYFRIPQSGLRHQEPTDICEEIQ